jgi:2'-hydroxyisoflavone reductase
MSMHRRDVLALGAAMAAAGGIGGFGSMAFGRGRQQSKSQEGAAPEAEKKLSLLILGGTGFLGPHIVRAAVARGHTMTLFNRGKTNPDLFADMETLHGDRNGDLDALKGRQWDGVIDTSGYVPKQVADSAGLLAASVKQYVFISTISVYAMLDKPGMDESAPLAQLPPGVPRDTAEVTGQTYGPLKALCEKAAETAMPGRVTNVRPGLIVGPGDPTDRFTYWPVRVQRGGYVLSPGTPRDPVQFIDARDLAAWVVLTLERGTMGVFNATGPVPAITIGELLDTCKRESGSEAQFVWVDVETLAQHNVHGWSDMPVWVPPVGDSAGFCRVSVDAAAKAGLTFRGVDATVRDTLAWWKGLAEERRSKLRAGISAEREAEVLKAVDG